MVKELLIQFIIDLQNVIVSVNNCILENIGIILGFIGMVMTWWIVHRLNLKQQKELLKNNVKMKVYEESYEFKKGIEETKLYFLLHSFSIKLSEMENVKITKKTLASIEKNFESLKLWNKYVLDISQESYKFSNAYLKLWNHVDIWISIMPELREGKEELFEVQFKELMDDLHKYEDYLRDLSVKNYKWNEWNKEDIKRESEKIQGKYRITTAYLDDFMIEIHNCLVSPIFEYKKRHRENFTNMPTKYKVLTKDGIKEINKSN